MQLGDGDEIAFQTGIVTMSDFRPAFIAAGGEGAPILPFVDRLLFSGKSEDRLLLNIGGIANYTLLKAQAQSYNSSFYYSDTGPGNTLIDQAVQYYYRDRSFDEDGSIAASGEVDRQLLDRLLQHPFFKKDPPKSTGPETFSLDWVFQATDGLNYAVEPENLVATLTRLTVESIARAIEGAAAQAFNNMHLYVSGGGVHNATLMQELRRRLADVAISKFEDLGISCDAREAVSFAVLGNQSLCGEGVPVGMKPDSRIIRPGKLSMPNALE
jgi:anhydro-N-acetylmuramic acid kinase